MKKNTKKAYSTRTKRKAGGQQLILKSALKKTTSSFKIKRPHCKREAKNSSRQSSPLPNIRLGSPRKAKADRKLRFPFSPKTQKQEDNIKRKLDNLIKKSPKLCKVMGPTSEFTLLESQSPKFQKILFSDTLKDLETDSQNMKTFCTLFSSPKLDISDKSTS